MYTHGTLVNMYQYVTCTRGDQWDAVWWMCKHACLVGTCSNHRLIMILPGLQWWPQAGQAGLCVRVSIIDWECPGAWQQCYLSCYSYTGTQVASSDSGIYTIAVPRQLEPGLHTVKHTKGGVLIDAYMGADYVKYWHFKSCKSEKKLIWDDLSISCHVGSVTECDILLRIRQSR